MPKDQIEKSSAHSTHLITINNRIKKLKELDDYLPHSSLFYAITNVLTLEVLYMSKNVYSTTGYVPEEFTTKGLSHFWSYIHADDLGTSAPQSLDGFMNYMIKHVDKAERSNINYCWNYLFMHASGNYVNINQNTTPIVFDEESKPIWVLNQYTVFETEQPINAYITVKQLNKQRTYDTVYFKEKKIYELQGDLSPRERDIVRLLLSHKTSKEIAEQLSISSNTVDTHRRNILKKMNLSSTSELIGMLKGNMKWL